MKHLLHRAGGARGRTAEGPVLVAQAIAENS
jgi:hypothetical protein